MLYEYRVDPSWDEFFQSNQCRLNHIFSFIETDEHIVPSLDLVFKPFELISLDRVKVVIVGQNPYNTAPGMSNGLAFSVPPEIGIGATLETIDQELIKSYGKPLSDTTLMHWVRQGVLLLNSTFTTTLKGKDCNFSHDDVWSFFIENLMYWISRKVTRAVFLLWGKSAGKYTKVLKGSETVIIKSPFPLSRSMHGESFVGSQTFEKCNKALVKAGKTAIDWTS